MKPQRIGQKAKGEGLNAKKRERFISGFVMAVAFAICHLPLALHLLRKGAVNTGALLWNGFGVWSISASWFLYS